MREDATAAGMSEAELADAQTQRDLLLTMSANGHHDRSGPYGEQCSCGGNDRPCPDDVILRKAASAMTALLAEVERLSGVETKLRGHLDAIGVAHRQGITARRSLDAMRDKETAELRAQLDEQQRLAATYKAQATMAGDRLEAIGETEIEWGVQWIGDDGKPFCRHWCGKDEAVQTVTNNHARGNGDAQLLHRLVGQPHVATVEVEPDSPDCGYCDAEVEDDG